MTAWTDYIISAQNKVLEFHTAQTDVADLTTMRDILADQEQAEHIR